MALHSTPLETSGIVVEGTASLAGHAWAEESGTSTASIKYHEGEDRNGPVIMMVNLAANESVTDFFDGKTIQVHTGLYVEITGNVCGSVFTE